MNLARPRPGIPRTFSRHHTRHAHRYRHQPKFEPRTSKSRHDHERPFQPGKIDVLLDGVEGAVLVAVDRPSDNRLVPGMAKANQNPGRMVRELQIDPGPDRVVPFAASGRYVTLAWPQRICSSSTRIGRFTLVRRRDHSRIHGSGAYQDRERRAVQTTYYGLGGASSLPGSMRAPG